MKVLRRLIGVAAVSLPWLLPAPTHAQGRALMLVYDTSGSLRPGQLRSATDTGRVLLSALAPADAAGVMRFDDRARLLAGLGPAADASAALAGLQRAGRYTVLNDALYDAARHLRASGAERRALLLFSDGRDEGSVLSLDDAVAACREAGVSVHVVGVGTRLDERSLRSLAKRTGGAYYATSWLERPELLVADLLSSLQPAAATAIGRDPAVPAGTTDAAPPESVPSPLPPPAVSSPSPGPAVEPAGEPKPGLPRPLGLPLEFWVPAVVGLALLGLVALLAVLRRQRGAAPEQHGPVLASPEPLPQPAERAPTPRLEPGPRAAAPAEEGEAAGAPTPGWDVAATAELPPVARPPSSGQEVVETLPVGGEPFGERPTAILDSSDSYGQLDTGEALESTRLLHEDAVLVVRRGRNMGAVFLLRSGGSSYLGRSKVNDIVVADEAVSSQHCKLRGEGKLYSVLDLQSTNGTFVNEEPVSAETDLRPGDVLRVGETELVFRFQQRRRP